MYVRARERGAQDLGAVNWDRPARLDHSGFNSLGQQPTHSVGAGTSTSKCDDVVGKPVILDRFDVGDYRLKPHHYDSLLELGAQVVNNASSAGGLALFIDGHADDTGAPFMNIGLSFNRALEVKRFLVEVIAHNSQNQVAAPMRIKGHGQRNPIRGALKSKNRRVEVRLCRVPSSTTAPSAPRQLHSVANFARGLGSISQPLTQCPAGTQTAPNCNQTSSSAERHIKEQDAPQIFALLCGPSPWSQFFRSNLNAHLQSIPKQRPIRIVTDGEFARKYKDVFNAPAPQDAQGFVDRRNATIYLKEFPARNFGRSLVGIALHEAVHLFSHPPGRSNQLRATSYSFLGTGLLEGLTQAITEDIQTAQCIQPMRERWQAYKDYLPVARELIRIFTPAIVGDAYFNGNVTRLLRVIEGRWTFPSFRALRTLTDQKDTGQALQLIASLEKAYSNRPKPKISKFQWVFR